MRANDVREKYLKFFEEKGHKRIDPAPLVLKNDPTTLFTSSGMQPLVPYLMGKNHPGGKRLVDSQPSFRAGDIEEVGDNRHQTFFEMLGNWSLGDYFKKEQLPWFYEYLTEVLGLPKEKIYVTVFEGDGSVPKDEESAKIWKSLGVAEDHIFYYGVKKNWWSRSGTPDEMPNGEIGGPDSEVFFEFTQVKHDKKYGEKCHPNCDCGRFLEIGNSVFIEYKKESGKLVPLPKRNVDFGGGLERLTAATEDNPDVFRTDLFSEIIESIRKVSGSNYSEYKNRALMRVIADHVKAATFLVANGVEPSNKLQGYIVRRLLRRAAVKMRFLTNMPTTEGQFMPIVEAVISTYKDSGYFKEVNLKFVRDTVGVELFRFTKTLDKGLREFEKLEKDQLNALNAFNLYQTYGFPYEIMEELFRQRKVELNKSAFEDAVRGHRNLSQKASEKIFKLK